MLETRARAGGGGREGRGEKSTLRMYTEGGERVAEWVEEKEESGITASRSRDFLSLRGADLRHNIHRHNNVNINQDK